MFKKPLKADITVTHQLNDEDKAYIDEKINEVKYIVKQTLITFAVAAAAVVVVSLAQAVVAEIEKN